MSISSQYAPTPLDKHQEPDISWRKVIGRGYFQSPVSDTMVVLESTTYPATEELFASNGRVLRTSAERRLPYLGFSPERAGPGEPIYKTKNTPKVVAQLVRRRHRSNFRDAGE